MWWLVKPSLLVFWGVILLIGQLCAQTEVRRDRDETRWV